MLFYIVRLAFRMQFYIVRLANSQCVVSRIRRQVNTGNIIIRKYSLAVCFRSNIITKATYKFEYYITIKSNCNIFTHIDKTNAVKNQIYKFTLPHMYILIPTSFQMKLGKLHSRKFTNAYRILDVFFNMLPTCFTFDNIHTMKFQQLYIGRNIFLSVNALKYSFQSSKHTFHYRFAENQTKIVN